MRYLAVTIASVGLLLGAWIGCGKDDGPGRLAPLQPAGGMGAGGVMFLPPDDDDGAGGVENVIQDPDAPCDAGIAVETSDPFEGAAAVGICKRAMDDMDWGLVDARWAMADGTDPIADADFPLGYGVLDGFGQGIDPREGDRMLLLSSGTARKPGHPQYQSVGGFDKDYSSTAPVGFPKPSPACGGLLTGTTRDDVALEVVVRAPPDAFSLAFDFDFFTYEWPEFVCSQFNDYFLALLEPFPAGQSDGNISFDQGGNVVSVNNALVRVCECANGPPCIAPPDNPQVTFDCEEGPGELQLTGFDGHASTAWLATKAPVDAGQVVKLRWTVYDSGDGVLDSSVLIDNFRWLGDPEDTPVTDPIK